VGYIPTRRAAVPGALGVDRDEASPVRASDSYGSGVSRPRKPDVESQKELRQISLEIEKLMRPRAESSAQNSNVISTASSVRIVFALVARNLPL